MTSLIDTVLNTVYQTAHNSDPQNIQNLFKCGRFFEKVLFNNESGISAAMARDDQLLSLGEAETHAQYLMQFDGADHGKLKRNKLVEDSIAKTPTLYNTNYTTFYRMYQRKHQHFNISINSLLNFEAHFKSLLEIDQSSQPQHAPSIKMLPFVHSYFYVYLLNLRLELLCQFYSSFVTDKKVQLNRLNAHDTKQLFQLLSSQSHWIALEQLSFTLFYSSFISIFPHAQIDAILPILCSLYQTSLQLYKLETHINNSLKSNDAINSESVGHFSTLRFTLIYYRSVFISQHFGRFYSTLSPIHSCFVDLCSTFNFPLLVEEYLSLFSFSNKTTSKHYFHQYLYAPTSSFESFLKLIEKSNDFIVKIVDPATKALFNFGAILSVFRTPDFFQSVHPIFAASFPLSFSPSMCMEVHPKSTSLDSVEFLGYFYRLGLHFLKEERYKQAYEYFSFLVTYPAEAPIHLQLQAFVKCLLAFLLSDECIQQYSACISEQSRSSAHPGERRRERGNISIKNPPFTFMPPIAKTHSTAWRQLEQSNELYFNFSELYFNQPRQTVEAFVEKNLQEFQNNHNLQLVQLLLQRLPLLSLPAVVEQYTSISFQRLGELLKIDAGTDLEKLILNHIRNGHLNAKIDIAKQLIRFPMESVPSPGSSNSVDLQTLFGRLSSLNEQLTKTDNRLFFNNTFLKMFTRLENSDPERLAMNLGRRERRRFEG